MVDAIFDDQYGFLIYNRQASCNVIKERKIFSLATESGQVACMKDFDQQAGEQTTREQRKC